MAEAVDRMLDICSGDISRVKTDSRKVGPGDVFIAIKGTSSDGHEYITEALAKGARAVVCESAGGAAGERVMTVGDTRKTLGEFMRAFYSGTAGRLRVYGVTGTNGKTTTVFLWRQILESSGVSCGMVSTVFNNTREDILDRARMTTPDTSELYRGLSEMFLNGKRAAAIEISSHALSQERAYGIFLESAVFTNISPEHLDYHGTMRDYLKDKAKIFGLLKKGAPGFVNRDDQALTGLAGRKEDHRIYSFGVSEGADIKAEDVITEAGGTTFSIRTGDFAPFSVSSSLFGMHNVYNILGASAALLYTGVKPQDIQKGLKNASAAPGRMEKIGSTAPFSVFIDYAHTPHALEKALECARSVSRGRVIVVFGCGGDRDRKKRPLMGELASALADQVILTSDNPRSEDPLGIIREIEKGMSGSGNYSIITEREKAIRESLAAAGDGDTVLIAGKGHEDYQIIGGVTRHFDDKEIAGKVLVQMGYTLK